MPRRLRGTSTMSEAGWIQVKPELLLPIAGEYGMVWAALGEGGCHDTLFVSDVLEVLPP